ncbi:MAG: ABC transporter permease [Proteobacteria bacterium]|nr:ABC transporter permease [Pseudomonadota bacterium]
MLSKRSPLEIQRSVLAALVLRELKTRFGGRFIGLLWVLFEPMAHIAIMLLIRVVLRDRYVGVAIAPELWLSVAIIPFLMTRSMWFQGMAAVESNGGLLGYRQVKPIDTLLARMIVELVLYLVVLVLFLSFFGWLGDQWWPNRPLEYAGAIALFGLWGFVLAMGSTVLAHGRPRVRMFIGMTSTPLYLLSGVLIPIHTFPPAIREYLLYNPFVHIVELSRWAFFGSNNHMLLLGLTVEYPLFWGLVMLALTSMAFWQYRIRLLTRV